jgi:hypothetical protein
MRPGLGTPPAPQLVAIPACGYKIPNHTPKKRGNAYGCPGVLMDIPIGYVPHVPGHVSGAVLPVFSLFRPVTSLFCCCF